MGPMTKQVTLPDDGTSETLIFADDVNWDYAVGACDANFSCAECDGSGTKQWL